MSKSGVLVVSTFVVVVCCLMFMTPQTVNSTPYGQVTRMELRASPADYNGPCPATISFHGFIRVDGPNTVIYAITRSDGATGKGQQTLHFAGAGQRPVYFTWRLGRPGEDYNGWAQIGSGNARSDKAEFHLHCR